MYIQFFISLLFLLHKGRMFDGRQSRLSWTKCCSSADFALLQICLLFFCGQMERRNNVNKMISPPTLPLDMYVYF